MLESTAPGGTIAPAVLAIGWFLLAGSWITVGLRVYYKVFKIHKAGIDDWLMIPALLLATCHTIFITIGCSYGLGHHYWDLTPYQALHSIKWAFISQPWTIGASLFGRLSFSALLLGIVGRAGTKRRASLWFIIAIQILTNVPVIIQIYAQCGTHFSANWGGEMYAGCNNPDVETYLGYAHAAVNSLCDLALAILPALILWDLKMKPSLKFSLISVMCLSVFAFGASIAKGVEIKNLASNEDGTRKIIYLLFCACIEENVVIMAASLATLRPLVSNKRKTGTQTGSGTAGKYATGGSGYGKGTIKAETQINVESQSEEEYKNSHEKIGGEDA